MITTMTDIDDLLKYVLRYAPNLPEPIAFAFLRDASREFCQRTKCWRMMDDFTISGPDYNYQVGLVDADIVYMDEVQIDGRSIEPITLETLDDREPGWLWQDQEASTAKYITQVEPNTVTVHPKQDGYVKARYVLQPSNDAEQVPQFLVKQYGKEIGMGAAAMALLMPDREFSNPALGKDFGVKFERTMRRYSGIVSKGPQRGKNRVKASFF